MVRLRRLSQKYQQSFVDHFSVVIVVVIAIEYDNDHDNDL